MKVVNASGHPITGDDLEVVRVVGAPHINPEWAEGIMTAAKDMANAAAPFVREGAAVALPGLSYLAAAFLAALYAETGRFPTVVWSVLRDGRYVWGTRFSLNLEQLKEAKP